MDDPSVNTQALPSGTHIEEFIIERVLGAGGFGITYLARDTGLNRQVVIKENLPAQFAWRETTTGTVRPRHTSGGDADDYQWSMNNFLREAETLASLDHPGIVRVLRKFEANGTAYFVMPFVDGLALDTLIEDRRKKGQPFFEEELKGLLERLLNALGYLHDRGIYHRDIKPGNILISNDGVPALIDFGSARQRLSERSMTVIESAGYTPFEQLQSRGNVGPWSDLYALGGTLVKVITGETPPKTNDRSFGDPWIPLLGRADTAGRFSDGFLSGIDHSLKLPIEDRWQSAGDWMAAVCGKAVEQSRAAISTHHPVTASVAVEPESTTGPVKKTNFIPWIVAACLVLGLFALGKSIFDDKAEAAAAQVMEAEQRAAEAEREKQELVAQAKAREEADAKEAEKQRAVIAEEERQAQIAQEKAKAKEKAEAEALAKAEMEKRSFAGSKAGEEKVVELALGVRMTFCWIPPGEFMMGSPEGELGRQDNETQHRVTLTQGYWMAKTEVTQAQWRLMMGSNPSSIIGDDLPVEGMNWNDIAGPGGFIEIMNQADAAGEGRFSLPTEAEWEYACRAGTTTALNSDKNLTSSYRGCANLNEVGWYDDNSRGKMHPVGQKRANVWGLHDMHGNVWELCSDWYGEYAKGAAADPTGPALGYWRVARGGSWIRTVGNSYCRSAYRSREEMLDERLASVGLRPVLRSNLVQVAQYTKDELINKGKTADTTNSKVIPTAFLGTWSPEGRTPEPGEVTNTFIDPTTFGFGEMIAIVISVMIHDGNSITIRSKTSSEGELDIEDCKMTLSENGGKLTLEMRDNNWLLLRNK